MDRKVVKKDKRGIEIEMVGWVILGIAVLILVIGIYLVLSGKASGALEFLKNILRLRR